LTTHAAKCASRVAVSLEFLRLNPQLPPGEPPLASMGDGPSGQARTGNVWTSNVSSNVSLPRQCDVICLSD
jgi:hypothetical protein